MDEIKRKLEAARHSFRAAMDKRQIATATEWQARISELEGELVQLEAEAAALPTAAE